MNEMCIQVVDFDGQRIDISYSEVEKLQGCIGVHPVSHFGVSYAGPEKRYVKIETNTHSYEIPRSPDNDTEILDFLLSQRGATSHG